MISQFFNKPRGQGVKFLATSWFLCVLFFLLICNSQAVVLLSDTFTDTTGTSLSDHSTNIDVNDTGDTYHAVDTASDMAITDNQLELIIGRDPAYHIDLSKSSSSGILTYQWMASSDRFTNGQGIELIIRGYLGTTSGMIYNREYGYATRIRCEYGTGVIDFIRYDDTVETNISSVSIGAISINTLYPIKVVDTGTNIKVYADNSGVIATTLRIDHDTTTYNTYDYIVFTNNDAGTLIDSLLVEYPLVETLTYTTTPTFTTTPTATLTISATYTTTPTPDPQILVYDSFTESNGTLLNSHLPDKNQGSVWSAPIDPAWTIQNNRMSAGASTADFEKTYIGLGVGAGADYYPLEYKCILTAPSRVGVNGETGISFRRSDNENLFLVKHGIPCAGPEYSYINFYKRVAGAVTTLAFVDMGSEIAGIHALRIVDYGNNIKVYFDHDSTEAVTLRADIYDTDLNDNFDCGVVAFCPENYIYWADDYTVRQIYTMTSTPTPTSTPVLSDRCLLIDDLYSASQTALNGRVPDFTLFNVNWFDSPATFASFPGTDVGVYGKVSQTSIYGMVVGAQYDLTSGAEYPFFYNTRILHRPEGSIGQQENGWSIRSQAGYGLNITFATSNSYTASTVYLNRCAFGNTVTVASMVGPVLGNDWVNLAIYDTGATVWVYADSVGTTATTLIGSAIYSTSIPNRKTGFSQGLWYEGNVAPSYDYVIVHDRVPTYTPVATVTPDPECRKFIYDIRHRSLIKDILRRIFKKQ